jgi:hypothetical protein
MNLHERLGLGTKKQESTTNEVTIKLTKGELETLIVGLGEATFKGKQVESVFKLALKLQEELKKMK